MHPMNSMKKEAILVVAAHPDDEVLGCGGTIAAHAARGDDVHVAILAQGLTSRGAATQAEFDRLHAAAAQARAILGAATLALHEFPDNRMDTVALLDVVKVVEALIEQYRPAIVYTHFASDLNVDHRITHEAVVTACRPLPGHPVERVLCFEVPSSTEWLPASSGHPFVPNWFSSIESTLDKKLAALNAYAGEMRSFPHPRSLEAVKHLAAWRGASAGLVAAEAFVLARQRIVI
ncbi:MAG TPA: PIG-L deacetylase family protein [Trinickia sp.]|jgi:LmbE family N-acetylglucosaminyl deacetylase|nr:PIG-L deacetylase family protein [Trinickia sp.]